MIKIKAPAFRLKASDYLSFSSSGSLLGVVERGGVAVWDVGARSQTFVGKLSNSSSVAVSPDDRLLVGKNTSGDICLWNIHTKEELIKEGLSEGADIVFSSDGAYLVDGAWTGVVEVLDIESLKKVSELQEDKIDDVNVVPGTNLISIVSSKSGDALRGCNLSLYSMEAGRLKRESSFELPVWVRFHRWSPQGDRVALVSFDHDLRIMDSNGKQIAKVDFADMVVSPAWSPDGKIVAVPVYWKSINFFDSQDLKEFKSLPIEKAASVSYPATGGLIAIGASKAKQGFVTETGKIYDL